MEYALVLRTCDANLQSYNGFQWPESGPVECPDYQPTSECGYGLHGLLWGEGDGSLLNWDQSAKWLVVRVAVDAELIDLEGKVKFRRGEVVHCGDRLSATGYLIERLTRAASVVGAIMTAGDAGTATAGYAGVLQLSFYDSAAGRRRIVTLYVGEDGILPNQSYCLGESGKPQLNTVPLPE